MDKFCDNQYCEFPAVKTVPAWDTARQVRRALCVTCLEAYMMGVQFGKYIALKEVTKVSPKQEPSAK